MMNKDEFLNDLRHALKGLPYEEVNKTLDYYSELIDDAVEDGADEKTFIAGLEDADTIAGRITDETSIRKLVAREVKGKRFSVPAIILIIVGSPIWLSILIAVAASLLALYVSVWSVVVSFVRRRRCVCCFSCFSRYCYAFCVCREYSKSFVFSWYGNCLCRFSDTWIFCLCMVR